MDINEKTCPACQTPIKPGDKITICNTCGIAHHEDCWTAKGGCTACLGDEKKIPRWGFADIIMVYIGIILVGIVMGFLGTHLPAEITNLLKKEEIGYFLFSFLIQYLATIGLVYLFAVFFPRGHWNELGVRKAKINLYLKYGVLGGLLLNVLVILLGQVIQHFQPDLQPQYYEQMLRCASGLGKFIMIFLAGAVLAPLSEELFYRGMIYPVFRKHMGPIWGAILAGLVFGLAHWDVWRTIPLAIGGAILCYIYEKTGSIFVSTVAHGVWNGVMSIIVYWSLTQGLI